MAWLPEAVQAEAGHTYYVCGREQKGQAMTEPGAFSSPAAGAVNRRRVHPPPSRKHACQAPTEQDISLLKAELLAISLSMTGRIMTAVSRLESVTAPG